MIVYILEECRPWEGKYLVAIYASKDLADRDAEISNSTNMYNSTFEVSAKEVIEE